MIGLAMCQVETGTNGGDINHQAIENLRAALRLDPENHSAYRQLFKAYGQIDQVAYAQWALAEYHALLRSPAAVKHAKRAMRGLPKTSAEFLRARDIVATSF
jgi:predicted Zn-dependent protease